MKNNYFSYLLIFFFASPFLSKAQDNNLGLVIADLLEVSSDFVVPAGKATAYQSASGWYVSAKPLGLWKMDFSIFGNVLFVPNNKTTSQASNSDYQVIKIRGSETAEIPTAFGGDTSVFFDGEAVFLGQSTEFEFQALEGIGDKIINHPFVQIMVGLPFDTDFSARFVPFVKIGDVKTLTYGFGLKHNINRYFRNSGPTDFQFAALLAYSKFKVDYRYEPLDIDGVATFDALKVNSDLWSFQFISSKSFSETGLEVSAAVGITNADFEYILGGNGPALKGLNQALKSIGDNEIVMMGHLGANYKINHFRISSELVLWDFYNLAIGVHYRF